MKLPATDTIILPTEDDGALVVDASEPPVTLDTTAQATALLELLPAAFRGGVQIDRDSVLAMERDVNNLQWAATSRLLAVRQSPRFADGSDLDWWGGILGRRRAIGELDPSYRARLLSRPAVITPNALKAAVNAVVAQFPPGKVDYIEPGVDEIYIAPASASDPVIPNSNNDSTSSAYAGQTHGVVAVWSAFTQPVAGMSTANQSVYVNLTKRLLNYYPDDVLNPTPLGYVVPVTNGAIFWVITSGDLTNDDLSPHCQPVDDLIDSGQFNDTWEFIAPATTSDPVIPGSNNDSTAASYSGQAHGVVPAWIGFLARQGANLGELIATECDARKGGGVAYLIMFDPLLATAI